MAKLKEFDIEVSELLSRTVKVEAETLGDAIEKVMEQYKKGEIVLDAEDFVGKRIEEKKKCFRTWRNFYEQKRIWNFLLRNCRRNGMYQKK